MYHLPIEILRGPTTVIGTRGSQLSTGAANVIVVGMTIRPSSLFPLSLLLLPPLSEYLFPFLSYSTPYSLLFSFLIPAFFFSFSFLLL
ncbi:hypothetical protein V8C37DRAFT_379598 [Trichoderma ceciliae]